MLLMSSQQVASGSNPFSSNQPHQTYAALPSTETHNQPMKSIVDLDNLMGPSAQDSSSSIPLTFSAALSAKNPFATSIMATTHTTKQYDWNTVNTSSPQKQKTLNELTLNNHPHQMFPSNSNQVVDANGISFTTLSNSSTSYTTQMNNNPQFAMNQQGNMQFNGNQRW